MALELGSSNTAVLEVGRFGTIRGCRNVDEVAGTLGDKVVEPFRSVSFLGMRCRRESPNAQRALEGCTTALMEPVDG